MRLRVLLRLLQIQRVLVQYGLHEIILATHLFRPLRFVFYLSPATWFKRSRQGPRGERLRLALEALGPIFMKFGQTMSTRRDLLPPDIADELALLQDRVPPFPSAVAQQMLQAIYGRPLDEVFARFDAEPLAAATIAQVHGAQLLTGEEVVVKIVRPNIKPSIERDIEVMYALARLAVTYWKDSQRLHPVEVVREYEKTILDELDLMREAANAAQLRRNFIGSRLLYVPTVYWDYCRKEVMVMERINGVLISDLPELRKRGVNIRRLAENGVEIFFTQAFRHNFFHADMHPGNIFVLTDDPENPRYAAVDFGIVGTLDPRDQRFLAQNTAAFLDHDYRRIAELHVEAGWVPAHVRIDELESAVRTVCEPIANKPLKDISFGQVLLGLFAAAQRFDAQLQPQLVLIQKTLLQIEGLGRQLYPELDLWQTAQPLLNQWSREHLSFEAVRDQLRKELPSVAEALRELPQLAVELIQRATEDRLHVKTHNVDLAALRVEMAARERRLELRLVAGFTFLGAMLWLPEWIGWALLVVSVGAIWRARTRSWLP
ncbi:MAG: ubiquinone biosynthesis regulatory protein kinase UbiB [Steroidobacteraceae bacterium]